MAKVLGVGCIFLRSNDPVALQQWYADALGIEFDGENGARFTGVDATSLVLSLVSPSSTYIGDPKSQTAMVNFIVDDLDAVVARLAEFNVECEPIQVESYGRFSWAHDPEGHRFELWQSPNSSS